MFSPVKSLSHGHINAPAPASMHLPLKEREKTRAHADLTEGFTNHQSAKTATGIQRKCAHCEERVQPEQDVPVLQMKGNISGWQGANPFFIQSKSTVGSETIQRKTPGLRDPIHDQLLDSYSDFLGEPREKVSTHGTDYAKWLESTRKLEETLKTLIAGASWKEIRKRVYPKRSAPGLIRAYERKQGSLPDLTGIGRIKSLDRFAQVIRALQKQWTALGDAKLRMDAIEKAANAELKDADVPVFKAVEKEPLESKGYFFPFEWKYVISEGSVSMDALTDQDAGLIANTTLHECRHAEQTFLVARYSAGILSQNAATISQNQYIPLSIAKAAVSQKFDAKTDPDVEKLGTDMYQAKVIDGSKNHDISAERGWDEMYARRELAIVALTRLQAGATADATMGAEFRRNQLEEQIKVVEINYENYRNIPYEADAHEVGDAAEMAFKGWQKP